MNTDIQQLARFISLPATPTHAQWQVLEAGRQDGLGPNDWGIVAVLTFSADDAAKIITADTVRPMPEPLNLPALDWFSDDVHRHLEPNGGDGYRYQGPSIPADAFFSSPLLNGYAAPLGESGKILLYLFSS